MTAAVAVVNAAASAGPVPPVALGGLTVRYGRTLAVDDLTLSVPQGSVYALLGRNGAGKSSAVRCLLGQRRPERGRALLFGADAWRERQRAMQRTGVVPEEPDAPPEMTARALARFCGRLYRRWDAAAVEARLARFRVPEGVPFKSLSKGQKAQVMLTLALGHGPELLVLDDPTLGLDAIARGEVLAELVGELADRGSTIFLTTHDLAGVERIATRVGILRHGRLVVDEELEALKARFRRIRLARSAGPDALAALEPVERREREWGVEVLVGRWDEAAFARAGSGTGTSAAAAEVAPASLEAIFTALASDAPAGDTGVAAPATAASGGGR